jgi:ATP-dependent DNA helicase Rep
VRSLNSAQRHAVRYIDGPLLVLAGAGSGKTRVITHKIAYLIRNCGVPPAHIAAVTFTNKAAREMRARAGKLLGRAESKGLTVSTFHTLGLNLIRREHRRLEYKPGFSIFDPQDGATLLRELMRGELTADPAFVDKIRHCISRWKNALVDPGSAAAQAGDDPVAQAAARAYPEYVRQLHAYNAVDLDDLIYLPVQLLRRDAEVRREWEERVHHLLVDEYQDTNAAQYELVRLLVGARAALTVVGDDDQSIYAWRGAQPENLARLADDFHALKVVKLEQNYRSTGRILKAANALIANNPHVFPKRLWSELGYGDPLRVIRARSEEHEAERVISGILHHRFKHRSAWRDYAILYRGNHQSRLFERVLREHRIPYYLSGDMSFFDRSEIKDVMAYLRLVSNPNDDAAFLRVVNTPRRGIGAATLEALAREAGARRMSLMDAAFEPQALGALGARGAGAVRDFAQWVVGTGDRAQHEPAGTLVRQLLIDIGYGDWIRETTREESVAARRLENVDELVGWLERLGRDADRTLSEVVADLTVQGILDREEHDDPGDQVALMTLHAAKGLEFPHVHLVGCEEGLLPHRQSVDEGMLAEERRLFYVGVTRARRTLTLSFAARRKRFGQVIDCEPSRFLSELPADDLQWEGAGVDADPEEKRERARAHMDNLRQILAAGSLQRGEGRSED